MKGAVDYETYKRAVLDGLEQDRGVIYDSLPSDRVRIQFIEGRSTMKRNSLTTALLAGLAGALGGDSSPSPSQEITIGLGRARLYDGAPRCFVRDKRRNRAVETGVARDIVAHRAHRRLRRRMARASRRANR